jgi:hypothetical protein
MRNISKFSQETRNSLSRLLSSDGKLVTFSLAKVFADRMVLPTTPIKDLEQFYKSNIETSNFDTMMYIGEILPLDYQSVEDTIRIFWKLRYEILHDSNAKLMVGNNAFDFFGLGFVLSQEQIAYVVENSAELCRIYNLLVNAVVDIEKRIIESRQL